MNFTYNNKNYPIIINYKNNKNLYIKVDDDFNIRINSPYLYPKLLIKKIVKENYKSIAKMIDEKERKKSVNNNMRNKPITTEKNYNKELKEALKIIKLSIEDTRFDNKGYRNIETEEFINKMEKKLTEVELQMDKRSKKSKELLEILLDRSNI